MARPRRIGGLNKSQHQRERAMITFRAKAGPEVLGGWKHQCYCGSLGARFYRNAWWCSLCGREQVALPDYMGQCGCALCKEQGRIAPGAHIHNRRLP